MNRQTMFQAKKESQPLKTSSLFRRQAAQAPVEEREAAALPVNLGRDFSGIPFKPVHPAPALGPSSISCPFTPQRCPFGGACHACPPKMQAKLKIGQPGDKYEQEADRVAETVMRMPEPQVQRKCSAPGCKDEEEKKLLQTKSAGSAGNAQVDHPLIQNVLSSPGQPLDAGTRSFMEPRFGQDFSGVRVHVGGEAAESARAVNARAYTVGRDVVFGEGQYAPGSDEGKRLVAHELVHVGQQQSSSSPVNNRVQRRTLGEVGAIEEGWSLRLEDGEWVAPGRAGFSQLLVGASGEMAQSLLESGDIDGLMLTPITPNLSGMERQMAEWWARARQAEEERSSFNPPSIEAFHEQNRVSATRQVRRISQAQQQLLSKVHDYNAFTAKANTFIASAAHLSSMQAILGATDNQSLANALVAGIQEATQVASDHQRAYRLPGGGVTEQLTLPPQVNTVDNSLQAVNIAGIELRNSYNNFRVNMMQDFILRLQEAGQQNRDRRDEINRNKEVIANIGTAIDAAMPYISPSSSMLDAAVAQGRGALPTPGRALTIIGDLAYRSEIESIERRLAMLDTVISAERATIDAELYRNRREDFERKLQAMKNARDELNDHMIARRESYQNLGEQLDRFARSSAGGNRVRRGQEHFTTILTVTSQVREVLSVGSWAANGSPSETEIRAWVSSMFEDHTSSMYRFSRITEGEIQAIRGMYRGIRQFATQWHQTNQIFSPVGNEARRMFGSGSLRAQGSGEY